MDKLSVQSGKTIQKFLIVINFLQSSIFFISWANLVQPIKTSKFLEFFISWTNL